MSSDLNEIVWWNNATSQMNRYFSIFIFLFGTAGNILNILVLGRRNLRSNPCACLFLGSSVASFIAIVSGLLTRLLSGWAVDLTNTVTWLCQIRTFIVFASRTIAYCFIALATIERWLSSCPDTHRRQMSNLKNSQLGMIIIILFSCLFYVQMFYCYEANLVDAPLKCYGKTIVCRLLTDLTYALAANIIPLLIMVTFGSMTIFNLRKNRQRIHTLNAISTATRITGNEQAKYKKTDQYLLLMLFVQVILFAVLTLPQNIQKFYSLAQSNASTSALNNAIQNFIFNFLLLFAYLANGISFYIYTLFGGRVFRKELFDLIRITCKIY